MLVSIITCAYNSASTIAEAIDSVLNQTYKEFEYIIVNDGSTDQTLAILNDYKIRDNRITIISHKNVGAGLSRNKAISIARGELVAFLDADDVWFPAKLEIQLSVYQQMKEPAVIIADVIHYDIVSNIYLSQREMGEGLRFEIIDDALIRLVENDFFFSPAATLVPKVFFLNIGQYTDDVSGQDYFPFLMFALYGKLFVRIFNPLYGERSLAGSLQRTQKSKYFSGMARFKAISSIIKKKEKYQEYLTENRITILKKANDRYLGWALYGARKSMSTVKVMLILISHYSSFINKDNFVKELFKTLLYSFKRLLNNR